MLSAEDGRNLIQDPKGLCFSLPTRAFKRLYTASLPVSKTSNTWSDESYSSSGKVNCRLDGRLDSLQSLFLFWALLKTSNFGGHSENKLGSMAKWEVCSLQIQKGLLGCVPLFLVVGGIWCSFTFTEVENPWWAIPEFLSDIFPIFWYANALPIRWMYLLLLA